MLKYVELSKEEIHNIIATTDGTLWRAPKYKKRWEDNKNIYYEYDNGKELPIIKTVKKSSLKNRKKSKKKSWWKRLLGL